MPSFGPTSRERLATCHPDLILLMETVVRRFDTTILQGHRGEAEQNAAVAAGNSQLRWPHGKHNSLPSTAVDAAPYKPGVGVDWSDRDLWVRWAVYVLGVAEGLGIKVRWGGDWARDWSFRTLRERESDQGLDDLPHFELVDPIPTKSREA